jgi:HSP20 family protein
MSAIIRRAGLAPRAFTRNEFLTPFDRLFDDMLRNMFPTISNDLGDDFFSKGSYPKVNVIDSGNNLVIEAAIPGMSRDEVDVEVIDKVLTIRGGSNQHKDVGDNQYVRREIKRSAFQRSFRLSENLDAENISGAYDNGVLTLAIPKLIPTTQEKNVRKIEIS